MDDSSTKINTAVSANNSDIAKELEHINQEMYKKNLELAERNKTLALLRKIDEIILSAVTDPQEIAQQVANVVVSDAEFKAVVIFLLDKKDNSLVRLAVSQTEQIANAEKEFNRKFQGLKTFLTVDSNTVVKAVNERTMQITHNLFDVLTPHFTKDEAKKIQEIIGVVSALVYPLIVRGEVIGAMIISIGESEESLSSYERDLIARLSGVIGIAMDNALLFKSLKETTEQLQLANEKLKKIDELKDEFVSLASHELRTPMTAIKSYLWLVIQGKAGETNEKQKLFLDRAYMSTDRLIKLVNDMLNVSRIESGRLVVEKRDVNYREIVEDTIAEIKPRADEQKINLALQFEPKEEIAVFADPDKIKEVLINLIGNSLKFTPENGNITVKVERKDSEVITSVSDTGKGIKQEDIPKLFKKFGMLGGNYLVKQSAQGTGLGLYISKSIIELHNGKMWVESEGEGKGSKFTFSLPIASSITPTLNPPTEPPQNPPTENN